jgi:hypothetical protein
MTIACEMLQEPSLRGLSPMLQTLMEVLVSSLTDYNILIFMLAVFIESTTKIYHDAKESIFTWIITALLKICQ